MRNNRKQGRAIIALYALERIKYNKMQIQDNTSVDLEYNYNNSYKFFFLRTRVVLMLLLLYNLHYFIAILFSVYRRYFQHAHLIPVVDVGKRGEY